MEIYRELGERVDRAFERANRDDLAFPRIAADALREARIPERSSADEVLAWLFAAPSLPPQSDLAEAFGEPPVTVYRGRDFSIQVLFWLQTVTTVHRHGFSGAFQALSGDRLQTRHGFHERTRINARVLLGDIRLVGAEILRPGDVVEITNDLVHGLVHFEAPSTSIVVRTDHDPAAGPQFDFRWPALAWDPFHSDDESTRRLQGLRLLCSLGRPDALDVATDLAARSDFATGFRLLALCYRTFGTCERIASVIEAAGQRHGAAAVADLLAVLREERRVRAVHGLRRGAGSEQRFFLALLHYLPTLDDVLPFVAQRFPDDDPLDRLETLASSFSGTDRIGVDFDDELTRRLFRALLESDSPAGVRRKLSLTYDAAQVKAQAKAIDRHAERIRGTALAPLFRRRAGGAAR
jgi:hypothetical protein